ncbi:sulfatase [Allopusillimonas soli]|uniref:Sulfatase n=1 Tax=Allopusillimonas soli TaxID=659016 RepID=A0A853FCS4_9BURK|nr:sulfatase [Allopusillimonas soli]NYT38624.1 sulfatase [Allopusillimonas soli]TEA71665.1 sulfatase [Allopusillimonas soli]
MRTVFLLFDSLVRGALECYGGTSVHTPNFKRFAERAVTFDNHFAGSLPCMPARRDMHTGRLNFLHRSWGPLEPFDQSFSELLRAAGTYTHLVSDHYHYWEDGGATYHNRYSSWEFIRGQEWDKWKAMVEPPLERFKTMYHAMQQPQGGQDGRVQAMVNREFMREESDFCCPRSFDAAFEFLDRNRGAKDWLLHLECFDPHEPFFAPARFRERYPTGYTGPILDWPRYKRLEEHDLEVRELRANYAALLSMCDFYLGRFLDYMDRHDLWRDTAVILTTDHGFLLAEHDWWGKNRMPFYNEIAHIPLMVHHPDFASQAGSRRSALTQTMDIMPTLLDLHGVQAPETVRGHSLLPVLEQDKSSREAAVFGMFGAGTNITDGRYTYFRYPEDMTRQMLYEYTLMPMHLKSLFHVDELRGAQLVEPFGFTQGVPLLKVPARRNVKGQPTGHQGQGGGYEDTTTVLYDLKSDYAQQHPFRDEDIERRLLGAMADIMCAHEAPPEAFTRLGLAVPDGGGHG